MQTNTTIKHNNTPTNGIGLSEEEDESTSRHSVGNAYNNPSGNGRPSSGTSTPVLDKFSTDLTAAAKEGKLDPVVGRAVEMARVTEILCRRKKNNPILIGEPGVGKSAIAEGLAQMIAKHHTSPLLSTSEYCVWT